MFTVAQVAERLNVSEALVYGWVQAGDLAYYRFGGKGHRGTIRVAEADLEAFLTGRKQKQGPKQPAKQAASAPKSNGGFRHLKVKRSGA